MVKVQIMAQTIHHLVFQNSFLFQSSDDLVMFALVILVLLIYLE